MSASDEEIRITLSGEEKGIYKISHTRNEDSHRSTYLLTDDRISKLLIDRIREFGFRLEYNWPIRQESRPDC